MDARVEAATSHTRRAEFIAGVRDTFPLVVGAIPFGIIFGALAVTSGISAAGTMGLSAIVFAGSAQFIATGLVAGGASTAIVILTTFVVNARHALYGATLSPHMKRLPQRWLIPLGFWLTDESFVIVAARYGRADASPHKHWYFLGSAIFMYINWNAMTFIGLMFGERFGEQLVKLGFDFAMIVTFIGMLLPLMKSRPLLVAALVAAVSALLFHPLPNQLWLIVAALLGIAAGYIAEQHFATPEPRSPADALAGDVQRIGGD